MNDSDNEPMTAYDRYVERWWMAHQDEYVDWWIVNVAQDPWPVILATSDGYAGA